MLYVLSKDGLLDHAFVADHTSGWDGVREIVETYPPERASAITGLSPEIIVAAALRFGRSRAALTLWSMGINQSHVGTDKNAAILNLHLATGQIGRPGAGPFSLTGQPNAMGGRETGGLAHLLPGSLPRRGARRSRSSRGWRRVRSARSGSSAPTPRPPCPTWTWSRRRFATPNW